MSLVSCLPSQVTRRVSSLACLPSHVSRPNYRNQYQEPLISGSEIVQLLLLGHVWIPFESIVKSYEVPCGAGSSAMLAEGIMIEQSKGRYCVRKLFLHEQLSPSE